MADNKNNPTGNPKENITLFEGIQTDMGKYHVTYQRDTFDQLDKRFFELKFESKKSEDTFFLYPDVLKNNNVVTAKMKLNADGVQMYNINNVIVSSSHLIKYNNSNKTEYSSNILLIIYLLIINKFLKS